MNPEFFALAVTVIIGGITVGYTLMTQCFHYEPPTIYITGGWCGLCGRWLGNEKVDARWPYTVCPDWEVGCFHKPLHKQRNIKDDK